MKRIIRAAVLVALLAVPLGACSNGMFDPTALFEGDLFNTKKKLPGERQPVFPEGTPGVPHGVPPELVRGYQPPAEPPADPVIQAGAPREEVKPKPKPKAKPKPKEKVIAQPAPPQGKPTAVTVRPAGPPSASPWPDPPAPSQQPRAVPAQGSGAVQWPDPPAPR